MKTKYKSKYNSQSKKRERVEGGLLVKYSEQGLKRDNEKM